MLTAFVVSGAIVAAIVPSDSGAAGEKKQLRSVRGITDYQLTAAAPLTRVFGRFDLPDEAIASTQAQ